MSITLGTVGALVTDGAYARYGRWARSLRTVGTLVADFEHARCGLWACSLRTVGTLVADERLQTSIPVTGRSSYQYFYANSNEDNAAKQLWTEMTTSHRTKTDAQPMT